MTSYKFIQTTATTHLIWAFTLLDISHSALQGLLHVSNDLFHPLHLTTEVIPKCLGLWEVPLDRRHHLGDLSLLNVKFLNLLCYFRRRSLLEVVVLGLLGLGQIVRGQVQTVEVICEVLEWRGKNMQCKGTTFWNVWKTSWCDNCLATTAHFDRAA